MVIRFVIAILGLSAFWAVTNACGQTLPAPADSVQVEIQSVAVNGRPLSWRAGEELHLPPVAENVSFRYGFARDSNRAMRLRYKLEGYDQTWREGPGEMYLAIRFLDDPGEQLALRRWNVSGASPGWSGDLATATFSHRTETVVVPPGAAHIQVMISSAGPPATVGIYVVDDLVVSKLPASGGPATVLIRTPFSQSRSEVPVGQNLPWERQGTRPSMARIVEIGRSPVKSALAILDEDPRGHAEWDSPKATSTRVNPGDQLLVEWNEVYSMGLAVDSVASYEKLPQGTYRFCVGEVTAFGRPAGAQASLVDQSSAAVLENFLVLGCMRCLGRHSGDGHRSIPRLASCAPEAAASPAGAGRGAGTAAHRPKYSR